MEEDIPYIIQDSNFYISKGENFDAQSTFSEYEIIKVLGEGGFGQVLLGIHKQTKEKVAIKILKTSIVGDAQNIDMVFKEAEVLKSLNHPNIVKIKQAYTLADMQVVFIMEYLEGGELLQRLNDKGGRFREEECKSYFKQLVEAMHYCHKNKLIHRDLKLENLLLLSSHSNIIRVCDFGIAGGSTNLNPENIDAGSLAFMSPEILGGKLKKLEPSIDIWAMGVILYLMLCGKYPFQGNNIINDIMKGKYVIPKDVAATISSHCLNVIEQCLIYDHYYRITTQELLEHPWLIDTEYENMKKFNNIDDVEENYKKPAVITLQIPGGNPNQNLGNQKNKNRRGSIEGKDQIRVSIDGRRVSLEKNTLGGIEIIIRKPNLITAQVNQNLYQKSSIISRAENTIKRHSIIYNKDQLANLSSPKNVGTELSKKYGPNSNKALFHIKKK